MSRCLKFLPLLVLLLAAGCRTGESAWPETPLELASFSENDVSVSIVLERDANGQDALLATFILLEPGSHLYGKDLPREGVDGLGRPTLLELIPGSSLQPGGELGESIRSSLDPDGLAVYPPGPVTLRLPVLLPPGAGWFDEQVSVTFMACSKTACSVPTVGRLVGVRIPGRDEE